MSGGLLGLSSRDFFRMQGFHLTSVRDTNSNAPRSQLGAPGPLEGRERPVKSHPRSQEGMESWSFKIFQFLEGSQ